jgi:GYF domain 2
MPNWYYIRDDQKEGPVPTAQLKELARSGRLCPSDMVWRAGMSRWTSADSLKGLFDRPVQGNSVAGAGARQVGKGGAKDNVPSPAKRMDTGAHQPISQPSSSVAQSMSSQR